MENVITSCCLGKIYYTPGDVPQFTRRTWYPLSGQIYMFNRTPIRDVLRVEKHEKYFFAMAYTKLYYKHGNQWMGLTGGYLTNVVDELEPIINHSVLEGSIKQFLMTASRNFLRHIMSKQIYFNTCISRRNIIGT